MSISARVGLLFLSSLFVTIFALEGEQSQNKLNEVNIKKVLLIGKGFNRKFNCLHISPEKSSKLKAIYIDVRSIDEQNVSRLPNAITSQEFEKNPTKYKGLNLVAYCTVGYRSGLFAKKYNKYNVYNLTGGVLAWSHKGGKFFDGKTETKRVHVYNSEWNFLHNDYIAVWKK